MKVESVWSELVGRESADWPFYRCRLEYRGGHRTLSVFVTGENKPVFYLSPSEVKELLVALGSMLAVMETSVPSEKETA